MSSPDYITWDPKDNRARANAMASFGNALSRSEPVVRTFGSDVYLNVAPGNISVRDGLNRQDYYDFRPEEATPKRDRSILRECMGWYERNGIVRNVIDLMSDFGVQGLDLVHRNPRVEQFYREWFRRVGGAERSERFLNFLYRCGRVIVKRQTAKLKAKDESAMRTSGADLEIAPPLAAQRREVPWRYTFLNPLTVEALAEELASFVGADAYRYAVSVPTSLARMVKSPKGAERDLVARLPEDVRKAIVSGSRMLPLDPDKLSVHHYKRDDWRAWATPMLAPLLKDLNLLEKMKLSDLAALDGAISCIRVWKLGNLEAGIMPNEQVIQHLAAMLTNNTGGGVMDLIWGPDIELMETSTEVHRYLGETKYAPVLGAIFQGLGVPPTLTGTASPGGFTNNYISLKTLTERLEYGRGVLRTFWQEEVRMVQRAMGFRYPAEVVFDRLLTDESAEKQLVLHMWDRNLVSDEYVRDVMGAVSSVEELRVRRDMKKRKEGQVPRKASPYHNANFDDDLMKLFAMTGAYAPSEMGVELEAKKPGEVVPAELQAKLAPKPVASGPKGTPGAGRPKNADDSAKRKRKVVKPRTSASAELVDNMAWAEGALASISTTLSPAYLQATERRTLRELTDVETRDWEELKFGVLCQLSVGSEVKSEVIHEALKRPLAVPVMAAELVRESVRQFTERGGRAPSIDVVRRFQAAAYAMVLCDYDE